MTEPLTFASIKAVPSQGRCRGIREGLSKRFRGGKGLNRNCKREDGNPTPTRNHADSLALSALMSSAT